MAKLRKTHLSIVHVTYTVTKCAHMRFTESSKKKKTIKLCTCKREEDKEKITTRRYLKTMRKNEIYSLVIHDR